MKRLLTLLLLLAPSVLAQNPTSGGPIPASTYTTPPVNANPTHGTGAPSGTCISGILYTNDSDGTVYTCKAGVWLLSGGGSGAGAPAGGAGQCSAGQTYTNTTNGNLYSCQGTTWVIVSGAGVTCASFNSINARIKDTSCLAGADMGARINTCNSTLGANGGICNTVNETSTTFSTAIVISNPIQVWACSSWIENVAGGITFNYTGGGNFLGGGGLQGCTDRAFAINKNVSGTMITISGRDITLSDVQLIGSGNGGITGPVVDVTGSNYAVFDKVTITNMESVGIQSTAAANNLKIDRSLITTPGIASSAGIILVGGSATISNSNITIQSGTGNAVSISSAGSLVATDSIISNSGTSGIGINCPTCGTLNLKANTINGASGALNSAGATLIAIGNTFGGGGSDTVLLNAGSRVQFSNNVISWSTTGTGRSGLHIKGDSIGNLISNNIINGGGTPSGNNYCIWLDTSSGGHFLEHTIEGNYCQGATNAFDNGIFYDNSTHQSSTGARVVNNICVDILTLQCIVRSDSTNLSGSYYSNNVSNGANTYGIAGGTAEIIVDFSTTFANLPTAGDGSHGLCTDCISSSPPAAGGGGTQLIHIKGQWAAAGVGPLCVNVTPVTTSGGAVSTDQNLLACSIPAGMLNSLNRNLRIHLKATYITAAANASTITIKEKLCTVSGCGSGVILNLLNITSTANPGAVASNAILLDGVATVQTAGATASFEASGDLAIDLGALTTSPDTIFADTNTATIGTIDSNIALFLQTSIAFSVGNAGNTGTGRQLLAWLE